MSSTKFTFTNKAMFSTSTFNLHAHVDIMKEFMNHVSTNIVILNKLIFFNLGLSKRALSRSHILLVATLDLNFQASI